MGSWLQGQLESLGVTTKQVDLGKHTMDGEELQLPPAIFGRTGDDPKKKTILIYGHYDVQPVSFHPLWCFRRSRDTPLIHSIASGQQERWLGHGAFYPRCGQRNRETDWSRFD